MQRRTFLTSSLAAATLSAAPAAEWAERSRRFGREKPPIL